MADSPNRVDALLPGSDRNILDDIVERLCDSDEGLVRWCRKVDGRCVLPSRDAVVDIVRSLRAVLFPGYFGASELTREGLRFHVGATLDHVRHVLYEQIRRGLCFVCRRDVPDCEECEGEARDKTDTLLTMLPQIRHLLATDVQAAYVGDPAARSAEETIFCYPGIIATASHRLAHELYKLDVPVLPRMISEHAHSTTGIDIHPGATLGESFFIDHGTGVVIGETSVIGNRVRIYQGVTLGARSFPKDKDGNPVKGIARHPIVEDDVIIYGGATILGRITIGKGAVIGGNVWLTETVPPGSRVTQARARRDIFSEGAGI